MTDKKNKGLPRTDTVSSRHYSYRRFSPDPRRWAIVSKTRLGANRLLTRIRSGRISGTLYKFIHNIFADNVIGIAAQTAFYLLLSLFPIVLVIASFLARVPLSVDSGILESVLPKQIIDILIPVMERTPTSASSTIIPIILSVWSASAGIWALMRGVCMSHTGNLPSFLKGRVTSIFLMFGFVLMILLSLGLWVFGEQLMDFLSAYITLGQQVLYVARYVFTTMLLFLFVLLVYVATPGFNVKKRYMVWGALFAAVGWELVSVVFEFYMNRFFRYSVLYGGIGAFLGLAIWLLAISMVILLGAELNALIVGLVGPCAIKKPKVTDKRKG